MTIKDLLKYAKMFLVRYLIFSGLLLATLLVTLLTIKLEPQNMATLKPEELAVLDVIIKRFALTLLLIPSMPAFVSMLPNVFKEMSSSVSN